MPEDDGPGRNRTWLIRGTLVVAILLLGAVAFLRDEPSAREGWRDCSASQVQSAAEVSVDVADVPVTLEPIATVEDPVSLLDVGDRMLVASVNGQIVDVESDETILDLSDEVMTGSERGLFDLALSPDGEWLYVHYSLEPDGRNVLRAWPWVDGAVGGEPVDILELEQPHDEHNGGGMVFGPDGLLYVALGDGGDDLVEDAERARDLTSWYGSIIRVEPTPDAGGYDVPADNPYAGDEDAASEIVHYGLRNPWQISFDPEGRLWIADVGHFCIEEINVVPSKTFGLNFGWPGLEGTYEWALPHDAEGSVPPVYEYSHLGLVDDKVTCAISGGAVYTGTSVSALRDVYVFSDLCDGTLRGIRYDGEVVTEVRLSADVESPVAVKADAKGEVYVLSFADGGTVYRVVGR